MASANEIMLQTAHHEIRLHTWSIERLHSKARTTIATAAVALSIIIVGAAGLASLHPGADHGLPAAISHALGVHVAVTVFCATASMLAILLSMGLSIYALRGRPISHIFTSRDFAFVPFKAGEQRSGGRWLSSVDDLYGVLFDYCVETIRTLEVYNRAIAPLTLAGQAMLYAGLCFLSALPLLALLGPLLSPAAP